MTIGSVSRITKNGRTRIYRNWIIFGPELLYDYEIRSMRFLLKGASWGLQAMTMEVDDRWVYEDRFFNHKNKRFI